jgi:hypothetical protein
LACWTERGSLHRAGVSGRMFCFEIQSRFDICCGEGVGISVAWLKIVEIYHVNELKRDCRNLRVDLRSVLDLDLNFNSVFSSMFFSDVTSFCTCFAQDYLSATRMKKILVFTMILKETIIGSKRNSNLPE